MQQQVKLRMIDLFCGAGGVSLGAEKSGVCRVIAAVNHDPVCIASHTKNFPHAAHFTEDIRTLNLEHLRRIDLETAKIYPESKLIIHASVECTHHSRAKGGPRDADSRTLPNDLVRYIALLRPDYLSIENVPDFLTWTVLDRNGNPDKKNPGMLYYKWVERIKQMGYNYDYRLINSADLGATTSRIRYFGIFWKIGAAKPNFPEQKYTQFPDMLGLPTWKPVANVLDLKDIGKSVFNREIPLVDKTLQRLINGVKRFVPNDAGQVSPLIMTHNSPGYCRPVTEPTGTLTTACHKSLVTPVLMAYYGKGGYCRPVTESAGTLTCVDRFALVSPVHWMDYNYSNTLTGYSLNRPLWSITTTPKAGIVSALIPAPEHLKFAFTCSPVFVNHHKDTNAAKDLKALCKEKGLADLYFRMLKVPELLEVQGFGRDYVLMGTDKDKKKQIGNAVVPVCIEEWLRAF